MIFSSMAPTSRSKSYSLKPIASTIPAEIAPKFLQSQVLIEQNSMKLELEHEV